MHCFKEIHWSTPPFSNRAIFGGLNNDEGYQFDTHTFKKNTHFA